MLLMKQCEALLKRLMSHQYGWVFNTPVDVVKLNILDYFNIIKHPMDLGTVKNKLTSGTYSCPSEFAADVRLTFSNAMTYNPPGNDVYIMADTLRKFFEVRWKTLDKKLPGTKTHAVLSNPNTHEEKNVVMPVHMAKKRKTSSLDCQNVLEPVKRVMSNEDRLKLGRDLESLTEFPAQLINFLRDHNSNNGMIEDDEIEIDINYLSDHALFQLRDLLDKHFRDSHNKNLLHGSVPGNSSIQHCDASETDDEVLDIGENEHPKSSISPVTIEKDLMLGNSNGNSLESVSGDPIISSLLRTSKGLGRKAEAQAAGEAAAEAKRKLELEREAARQALMENENAKFRKDLELLKRVNTDHLTNAIEEDGPDRSHDGLRSFSFGGSNPLEQLGLFMKQDEDEEKADPFTWPAPGIEIEEGGDRLRL